MASKFRVTKKNSPLVYDTVSPAFVPSSSKGTGSGNPGSTGEKFAVNRDASTLRNQPRQANNKTNYAGEEEELEFDLQYKHGGFVSGVTQNTGGGVRTSQALKPGGKAPYEETFIQLEELNYVSSASNNASPTFRSQTTQAKIQSPISSIPGNRSGLSLATGYQDFQDGGNTINDDDSEGSNLVNDYQDDDEEVLALCYKCSTNNDADD